MSRTATIVHAHGVDTIETEYEAEGDARWTNLVIGDVRLTIHGDHAKTAAMLMAAARQCPKPNCITYADSDGTRCALPTGHGGDHETYEGIRARTLAEDRG